MHFALVHLLFEMNLGVPQAMALVVFPVLRRALGAEGGVSWSCSSRDIPLWGADGCNSSLLHPSVLPVSPQLPSPPRSHQEEARAAAAGQKSCNSHPVSWEEASTAQGLQPLLGAAPLLLSLCWRKAMPLLSPPGLQPAELCHTQSISAAFSQGMAPTPHGQLAPTGPVPRHSKPGRVPPGWQCHKLLFAVGKEQFVPWPGCEMQNLFPAAAGARRGELMTFNLSHPHTLQTFHIKTF